MAGLQYNWEHGKQHKKIKETGTVILNPRDEGLTMDFDSYSTRMTEPTLKALTEKLKFKQMLPAQAQCFNGIHKGRDVILHSRTGSGKTLAYSLPIIERRLRHEKEAPRDAPFLLIFVFSLELAVQTKSVLTAIYGKRLKIVVPGFEEVVADQSYDILIGTVSAIDHVIRGSAAGRAKKEAEEERLAEQEAEGVEDDDEAANKDDDDEEEGEHLNTGIVSAANVRAIVVDEVDTTLGPKFSNAGRRMKNLLKYIRRANGSLNHRLTTDFRAHHYVLVGATIPNWVVKAGFLGAKKYYYRLVSAGTSKLPEKLDCYAAHVPMAERTAFVVSYLLRTAGENQRTVVFTNKGSIDALEAAFQKAIHQGVDNTQGLGKVSKKKKGDDTMPLIVRSLSPSKDEAERIQCMQEFNSKVASVLLCTDTAARGLDFADVHLVIMMALPHHTMAAESFVHRAGRTARIDNGGRCIALFDATKADDAQALKAVEAVTHIQFRRLEATETFATGAPGTPVKKNAVFELRVRNGFSYANADAQDVPSPSDILEKSLSATEFAKVAEVEEVDKCTLRFKYPLSDAHIVRKKLWKYDLKDLTDVSKISEKKAQPVKTPSAKTTATPAKATQPTKEATTGRKRPRSSLKA